MRPRIVDYLNQLFDTSVFEWLIPYPAFIYALAMLVCLLVFVNRSRRAELNQIHAIGAGVSAMIGGLIGARLLFVILYQKYYPDLIAAVFTVTGATISWGAYLGGIIGFLSYLLYHRQTLLRYLDIIAPILGLGVFIGRLSCFLNGCDFGRLSSLPWSVKYSPGSIPYIEHINQGLISHEADFSLNVHPVQLYLSLNGLLLFVFFTWLWKSKPMKPGMLFFFYWLGYSVTRFCLEFLRGDTHLFYLNIFSTGQIMTLLALAILCGAS